MDGPNLTELAVFVTNGVLGHQRVGRSGELVCLLGNVIVVKGSVMRVTGTGEDAGARSGAFDIIDLHNILSSHGVPEVLLGLSLFNIVHFHRVTDKLGWRNGSVLDLGYIVNWVQRVARTTTNRLELNTLRRRAIDVLVGEVGLRFVKANVQRAGTRAVDVPVLVRKLLLVANS